MCYFGKTSQVPGFLPAVSIRIQMAPSEYRVRPNLFPPPFKPPSQRGFLFPTLRAYYFYLKGDVLMNVAVVNFVRTPPSFLRFPFYLFRVILFPPFVDLPDDVEPV